MTYVPITGELMTSSTELKRLVIHQMALNSERQTGAHIGNAGTSRGAATKPPGTQQNLGANLDEGDEGDEGANSPGARDKASARGPFPQGGVRNSAKPPIPRFRRASSSFRSRFKHHRSYER